MTAQIIPFPRREPEPTHDFRLICGLLLFGLVCGVLLGRG